MTISGNVWNDADAGNVNLTETTNVIPTGLFANLLDALGDVVASVPVNIDGTYSFTTVQPATYTVQLSSSAGTVGSPATAYTTPDGWVNTGAFNGPENTGNTGTTTGTSAGIMVTSDNVSNINFGIQQLPESDTISTTITSPAVNDTLQIGIGALPALSGSDPEDGAYSGFTATNGQPQGIIITSLPTNGTLLYNGVAVEVGDTLTDIGAGVLEIVFTGTGYDETEFEYAYIDRAGFADPTPAVYSINWITPLPVSLLNFEVSKNNNIVILKWATASEQNNAVFHIEHSTDAANWKNIGFAKSKAENGNSSARLDYSHHHNSPAVGINYYRLKQMDIDGKFSISNVRQISFDQAKAINIHPNPATNVLTVEGIDANDAITVTDVLGKEVMTAKGSNATLQIDIAHLNAGTYYLNIVSADGSKAASKFVKK